MTLKALDAPNRVHAQPELFLAYAESDHDWVHGFLLPELGLDRQSVLTPQEFEAGAVVIQEFERAVLTARFTVLVLSPAFETSPWSAFAELLASHDSLRRNSDRLVPLLLQPYELPLRLDFRVRLDCTVPSRWEIEVARLRKLLQRDAPAAERLPCPYLGLLAFGPAEATRFFGRDRESDDICRRLWQHDFLLLVGPSGSGKSSLISAGVLPRLLAMDADRWMVRTLRPDAGALNWLTDTFGGDVASASRDDLSTRVDLLLHTSPRAERLLLVIDQAEAIFVLPGREERAAFLDLLKRLRGVDRCVVVLALRADFYGDLMTSELWPIGPGERVEIAPLRGAALRETIVRPAADVGVHLEPVLLERLLHDAGEEPGALPLVQETMVSLWERRTRRLLTVSAYEELGGEGRSALAAALATRADAACAALPPAQQQIARRIFVRLVQFGEGRPDTRRPQAVDALRASGDDPDLFTATLRHLTDRRLLTVSSVDGAAATVDLGHEAMIAHWPTLRDWVDESRASEIVRRRIERNADDWQRNGRDPGELYRRRKLADALERGRKREYELSPNAVAYLTAGRRRRLLGRLGLGIAVAAVASVVLLAIAFAIAPVREAWLKRQAQNLSPTVLLAGGPATVGPGHRRVTFPPLSVDVHEVTNQQYRLCVQARRCTPPYEPYNNAKYAHGDRLHPVVFVSAYQAATFCFWIGRRLPTEAEWERTARGTDGRRFPWGDARPRPGQVNAILAGHNPRGLVPVDAPGFQRGRSTDGVEHLLGNAAEWTATKVSQAVRGPPDRQGDWNGRDPVMSLAVKGGGWQEDVTDATYASPTEPTLAEGETGFRCIKTTR
jgi:formylglycine-generating enzyme required for sulfatase activity